ncbi:MAG: penicillin-binding protein [Solobacterium sp.]|jgi:penicillin-binding protein 1A|nr:penicillin-binding protein [Solobacterium sp.]MCH4222243.1 penicillin-binding protein [Solobacterium sp.]MCH4265763.1 penicillin-binding protein [Solobacterium sp.]
MTNEQHRSRSREERYYEEQQVHHTRSSSNHSSGHHKKSRKLNKRNLWTIILVVLVCIEMTVCVTGLVILKSMLDTEPTLNISDFYTTESSHIYDKDGNEIADVGTTIRENVTYEDLSESIIDAFLATEDSRFFSHDGFDLPRFAKAMIENVLSGSFSQGGSTFTMQLVKLTYFQNDETGTSTGKSITYKVQQIDLARQLEKQSSKKDIFVMYLNRLNFGGTGNIRGIQKASEYYYGKSASELNLEEAAMLAGVINSPYNYDPHNNLTKATSRRNTVLNLMERHGYITSSECKLAKSVKVEDTLVDPNSGSGSSYKYQAYIDEAVKEAQTLTGKDPLNTAMNIYTAMDSSVQEVMDNIQEGNYDDIQYPDDLMEIGATTINNQTGEVVAIAGGRNYGRGGSMLLNHATDQYKQPGSSVKPLLDYSLAFEYLGWATDHVVTDKPIMYEGTNVVIKNANGNYAGQVTLKYAVGMSLNTPAIQTLEEVINTAGWDTVVNYVMSLGFSQVTADNFDIGFAIGGSNFTCSTEELAAAYSMTMNGGYYIEPHLINKIEFRDGSQDPLEPTYEKKQVLSSESAYLTAQLMYDAVHTNYQNFLQILIRDNYQTYGKTGTSDWGDEGLQYNIPSGSSKDKWMVSETTQYTTAVWVGYEKGIKDEDTYFNSAKALLNIPGHISDHIMSALCDDNPPADLEKPEGVSDITHILGTFPYASPIEGMDSSYITTGQIKSTFNTLADPSAGDVSTLNNFSYSQSSDGSLNFTWDPYPDSGALQEASDTMDISLYDSDGNTIVSATGKRIFDYSWIYGPIRYKARISQNGTTIAEIQSDTETSVQNIDIAPNTTTEVCGFYGYENGTGESNEVCSTFTSNGATSGTGAVSGSTAQDGDSEGSSTADYSRVPANTNAKDNLSTAEAYASHYGTTVQKTVDSSKSGTFMFYDSDNNLLSTGQEIPSGVIIRYFTD